MLRKSSVACSEPERAKCARFQKWRNLWATVEKFISLKSRGGSCPEGLRRVPLGERGQRTMTWHRVEVRGVVGSGEGGGRKGERG
jgi:hypothetical protein